jgi:hypothetical protein
MLQQKQKCNTMKTLVFLIIKNGRNLHQGICVSMSHEKVRQQCIQHYAKHHEEEEDEEEEKKQIKFKISQALPRII